jgi:hypothetical protein
VKRNGKATLAGLLASRFFDVALMRMGTGSQASRLTDRPSPLALPIGKLDRSDFN